MKGKWVKKRPADQGLFWMADRQGNDAGYREAAYDKILEDRHGHWRGWWWSEPVEMPTPPAPGAWDKEEEEDAEAMAMDDWHHGV